MAAPLRTVLLQSQLKAWPAVTGQEATTIIFTKFQQPTRMLNNDCPPLTSVDFSLRSYTSQDDPSIFVGRTLIGTNLLRNS